MKTGKRTPRSRRHRRERRHELGGAGKAVGLAPRAFYVQAVGPAAPGGAPIPGGAALALRNDHLQYALTWFGLAAALMAVFLAFRRRVRRGGA